MTLPLEFRDEVREEVDDAYRWYEKECEGLGEEFLSEVRRQLDLIQDNPEVFGVLFRRVRACNVPRFRYVIYYRILNDRISVIAIQHGHRHPRAWRRRA